LPGRDDRARSRLDSACCCVYGQVVWAEVMDAMVLEMRPPFPYLPIAAAPFTALQFVQVAMNADEEHVEISQ